MIELIGVVDQLQENLQSPWGTSYITLPIEALEDLKQGKMVVAEVMEEYTAVISLGDELSVEDEC